jgi:hypothetical protein
VGEDAGLVAARLFQGVGEDREAVEVTLVVHGLNETMYETVIVAQTFVAPVSPAERVADDLA